MMLKYFLTSKHLIYYSFDNICHTNLFLLSNFIFVYKKILGKKLGFLFTKVFITQFQRNKPNLTHHIQNIKDQP